MGRGNGVVCWVKKGDNYFFAFCRKGDFCFRCLARGGDRCWLWNGTDTWVRYKDTYPGGQSGWHVPPDRRVHAALGCIQGGNPAGRFRGGGKGRGGLFCATASALNCCLAMDFPKVLRLI